MSQLTRHVTPALLSRLLAAPDLARRIQALPASELRRLVQEVGLEDAGELIALATHEQLRDVFDEDLWRATSPGADEAFDAERFALWIEMLHEAGDAAVADRLAQFSEEFLAFALARLIRVIDLAAAASFAADADEAGLLDKRVEAQGAQELDGLLVVPRIETGWDALWSALLALDARHGELARAVLRRIEASTEREADAAGGLFALLSEDEALAVDAAAEREDRRAERGFVSPADARAFLALASRAPAEPELDPITRAYFRAMQPARSGRRDRPALERDVPPARATESGPAALAEAAESRFVRALAQLGERDPAARQRAIEELAYLANVLVAGDTSRGSAWPPAEAAARALGLCEAGLRAASPALAHDAGALTRWGAVGLFRIAWAAESAGVARQRPQ